MSSPSPAASRSFLSSNMQEMGLGIVLLAIVAVLSFYGWHDAAAGRPNTFLNFDNLIDGVATPMSYYAIMAVGLTIVIITGGIDISVGSIMALAAPTGIAPSLKRPMDGTAQELSG